VNNGGDNHLRLTYTQALSATDITCIPKASGDLKNWDANSISIVSIKDNPDGVTRTVIVQDLVPMNSAKCRFIQLTVTKP